MLPTPLDKVKLDQIHKIALNRKDPFFDDGVLWITEQILNTGSFQIGRLNGLDGWDVLTPEEKAALKDELELLGWPFDRGVQFAKGVKYAARALGNYRV